MIYGILFVGQLLETLAGGAGAKVGAGAKSVGRREGEKVSLSSRFVRLAWAWLVKGGTRGSKCEEEEGEWRTMSLGRFEGCDEKRH